MLIPSERHTRADLEAWERSERADAVHAQLSAFRRRVERAAVDVAAFVAARSCYVGVSWGKDSVVVADLVARAHPGTQFVWVRVDPISNPDCAAVRDAFLRLHPTVRYDEIVIQCPPRPRESAGWAIWDARGTLEAGFAVAAERYGDRHISGVRGEESGTRKLRMMAYGTTTERTCAPIGHWRAEDVFAYLHARELPVHPAYACTMGGALDRGRVRVAALGGGRGTGMGRRQWEATYYRDEIKRLFNGRPAEGVC